MVKIPLFHHMIIKHCDDNDQMKKIKRNKKNEINVPIQES